MIDTPGVSVTSTVSWPKTVPRKSETRQAQKQILKELYRIFALAPTGLDAIMLVMKYGSRVFEEDRQTLRLLINFLGDRSKEYMILILTYGDFTRFAEEEDEISKEECIWRWISLMPEWVQNHIKDIGDRVVMFDNTLSEDKDPVGYKKQLTDLIKVNSVLYLRGFLNKSNCYVPNQWSLIVTEWLFQLGIALPDV